MKRSIPMAFFLVVALCCGDAIAALSTTDILRKADRARGNLEGVTWEVAVESVQKNRTDNLSFDVKARGFDILGENRAPAKYKGNKLLMLKGNMWFYKPGLRKPVPISRRQRLLGNAAYGDIASTNYAEDYEATHVTDEAVDGEDCYVFDLKSTNKNTTYDRIKYWVSKARRVGVKAEYFTVSGKIFKSSVMRYENRVNIDGKQRPFISKITIYDELMSADITTLDLADPNFEKLPDYIFNLNLLRR